MARFVLYRILGNDLPPRHSATQTIDNLSFLIAHEPRLADCDRRFLLNRIVDPERLARLQTLLTTAGHPYDVLPFDPDEYRRQPSILARMAYVTNNNPARNAALDLGLRTDAAYILPFDGQTFFTADGWTALQHGVAAAPEATFFSVAMYRVGENARLLAGAFDPGGEPAAEPQLIFTPASDARFDEELPYGQAPKVELLYRLGIPGPWDAWHSDWIRAHRQRALQRRSRAFGTVPEAGFVLRLESGNQAAEIDLRQRAESRLQGLRRFLTDLEQRLTLPAA
jgi:hypothetical protein